MPTSGFAETIALEVPASYAFAFLADPSTAAVIDPAVIEYRPDTTPMGAGTKNRIRFRMFGIPITATSEVTEWVPGTRMAMESIRPSRPVRVKAVHEFAPDGDRCTYTWSMEFSPVGVLGVPATRIMQRFMRTNAVRQQVRLREEVRRRWSDEERDQLS
jgi:ligand-binding SRPBCC domain-containing protein